MLIGIDASRATAAQRTGTENYSLHLIRALLRLGGEHRFCLYMREAPAEELFARSERVAWRVIPFPRLWTHIRLGWETWRHPPDVLFVPSHVVPLLHPRRCVVTVHDLGYLHLPQAHTRWSRLYLDLSTRWNARVARRVIADSEATRADLVRAYGVPPEKVCVAYPAGMEGLAPVSDPAELARVRERYGTGERYLLYVGTLQPRKNLAALVDAFRVLVQQGRIDADVRLVLAGKRGWLYDVIAAAVEHAGLGERIILPGYVDAEDLAALLSGALAFVFPSLYEGFGLPVLEAMACDTPVICSNASSLPEVVGDAALLVDPHNVAALADAMAAVCRDAALRAGLVQRGRLWAQTFTWERCAREVLRVLESVGE
ncbi:MAG: glycosyltransferase family 4 protein [Anaerolineae bacterium]